MRDPMPPDYRQHLQVETPEHVVLDYELAGIGSRTLAAIADWTLIFILLIAAELIMGSVFRFFGQGGIAVASALAFVVVVGYFALFEGFRRGQTPGKYWLGIRVVRDTGHAVSFTDAAARSLLKPVDMLFGAGFFLMAIHSKGKRLGDLVAGTVVVRDKPAEVHASPVETMTIEEENALGAPTLGDAEFQLLREFSQRAPALPAPTRQRLAHDLAIRFAAHRLDGAATDQEFLALLARLEIARRRGRFGARSGSPSNGASRSVAERLVARKGARWDEFQQLANRVRGDGLDSLGAAELTDFAARYREVAADLARITTYRADPMVRLRVERLVAAGHNALYREERHTWSRIWLYITRDCPGEIVASWRLVLMAWAAFMLPAAGGYLLLRQQPAMSERLLPDVMLERVEAGAARSARGEGYVRVEDEQLALMATNIMTNNIKVAFGCFAGGILLGFGSLAALAYNGLQLGAVAGAFANAQLSGYLWSFIVGHGVLELFAIWVAGAAGFLLGRAVITPGEISRTDAVTLAGRRAMRMIGAAIILLVIAGTIEGFISAGGHSLRTRLIVSGASLLFLIAYLLNGAAGRLRETALAR